MLIHAVGSCEWIVLLGDECPFHPVWMTARPSEEFGARQCFSLLKCTGRMQFQLMLRDASHWCPFERSLDIRGHRSTALSVIELLCPCQGSS